MGEAPAPAAVLRLVLVEDEALYRDMLATCLSQQPSIEVIGAFADSDVAAQRIPGLAPQVALLDIDLPGAMNGVELGLALRHQLPHLGVVLLSNQAIPQILLKLPSDAIQGWSYLLKRSVTDIGVLSRAIKGSAEGMVIVDPSLLGERRIREGGTLAKLTERQRQVLELLAAGYTNSAIAEALVLSENSVEKYITLVYQQLGIDGANAGVQPRVQAVLMYLDETRTRWSAARTLSRA